MTCWWDCPCQHQLLVQLLLVLGLQWMLLLKQLMLVLLLLALLMHSLGLLMLRVMQQWFLLPGRVTV
jgi:hypothetical protein